MNAGADPTNPQSWNGYAYVLNNPLNAIDPTGMTCQPLGNGSYYDDGDGLGCDAAGVGAGDPDDPDTLNQHQINAETNAQQTSIWDYLWTISTHQIPDQEIDNTVVPPTNQDYIDAIQQKLALLPNVCDVGITARVGIPNTPVGTGLDVNSSKGVRSAPSYRLTPSQIPGTDRQAPITVSASRNGSTVSVQAGNLFAGLGVDKNLRGISSVNAGARVLKGLLTIQGNASIGAVGRVVNPKCR